MDYSLEARRKRLIAAAREYAAADRSDPFAFSRAMTHIDNGIAGYTQNGELAAYTATPHQEERVLPDGKPYHVTVYRNVARP